MILALDIGNTNIEIGCMDDDMVLFKDRVSTDIRKSKLEYVAPLKMLFDMNHIQTKEVEGAILSSVVPLLTHNMKEAIRMVFGVNPIVVGAGIKTGLNIQIDNPATLGADLVVDSVAALNEYGSPVIVIDMGTATTITVIDKNKNYIGGAILPGVQVSLESLVSETSLLPRISFNAPSKVIGTNTMVCMQSGIIYGQASQVDGMIDRFEEELGYSCNLVATGGLSSVIIPKCRHDIVLDSELMLKGLRIIYNKNNGRTVK